MIELKPTIFSNQEWRKREDFLAAHWSHTTKREDFARANGKEMPSWETVVQNGRNTDDLVDVNFTIEHAYLTFFRSDKDIAPSTIAEILEYCVLKGLEVFISKNKYAFYMSEDVFVLFFVWDFRRVIFGVLADVCNSS